MPLERELGREDRSPDGSRGTIEDALEQRVFQRADLVALAHIALDPARRIGMPQCLDVGTVMKLEQAFDAGRLAGAEGLVRQPSEQPCEVRDGRVADDFQRVIVPERSTSKRLAADEDGQRNGVVRVDRAHCLNIVHASATESG